LAIGAGALMDAKVPRRSHSAEFKQKVCGEIRAGRIGRREAQRTYRLSDNLLQTWLARFDAESKMRRTRAASGTVQARKRSSYENRIAILERKVGELTMALERTSPRGRG
jgi:transposase